MNPTVKDLNHSRSLILRTIPSIQSPLQAPPITGPAHYRQDRQNSSGEPSPAPPKGINPQEPETIPPLTRCANNQSQYRIRTLTACKPGSPPHGYPEPDPLKAKADNPERPSPPNHTRNQTPKPAKRLPPPAHPFFIHLSTMANNAQGLPPIKSPPEPTDPFGSFLPCEEAHSLWMKSRRPPWSRPAQVSELIHPGPSIARGNLRSVSLIPLRAAYRCAAGRLAA
jgi:hypothetical protein